LYNERADPKAILSPQSDCIRQHHDEGKAVKVTMSTYDWLTEQFEFHRSHLRALAYRMLGSLEEAEDAVQEAWLRLNRLDAATIANLGGWLTTVTSRICLDVLRSRKSRPEESLEPTIPQIKADLNNWIDPEQEALMAESVGIALLVVLDSLSPAERLAFVLHDVFDMPFDEIARIVDRTPQAAKKLASRARCRVRGKRPGNPVDQTNRRKTVEAFLAASRSGDMQALIAVLDPEVVRKADPSALPAGADLVVRGAERVARETVTNAQLAHYARVVLVDSAPGIIVILRRRLRIAIKLRVKDEHISQIDVIADPARLRRIEIAVFE
jgi:RNA polymerase sigma factor (sigma-70 family)